MTQDQTNKGFVEHWRRVGPILEELKRRELREFNFEDHVEEIDALLDIGLQHRTERPISGLVEFQRLLHSSTRRPSGGPPPQPRT